MIKFKNTNTNKPFYATVGSAGFDIFANETTELQPGEYKAISTGLFIEAFEPIEIYADGCLHVFLPELQIRPRSGLALKNGVTVLNAPGTVDCDYFNKEIKVILINHNKEVFQITPDIRIAQGVVSMVNRFNNIDTKNTVRTGGFGSTN